jgi:hypothetical protein
MDGLARIACALALACAAGLPACGEGPSSGPEGNGAAKAPVDDGRKQGETSPGKDARRSR